MSRLLKLLRIYNKALDRDTVAKQFTSLQHLISLPYNPSTYWAQSTGEMSLNYPLFQDVPPPRSPSHNFANINSLAGDLTFDIYGLFISTSSYKAKFGTNLILNGSSYSEESPCVQFNNVQNKLTCMFPARWKGGYRSSLLSILESTKPATSWRAMWSRACFQSSCGYQAVAQRKQRNSQGLNLWFLNPPNSSGFTYNTISKGISGSFTYIWLVIHSEIYQLESSLDIPVQRHRFGAADESGYFANLKYPFSAVSGWRFPVDGASKIEIFEVNNTNYVFVANFWNGLVFNISSSIFRIDGNLSQNMQMTYVQGIETNGARDFRLFFVDRARSFYVAVANFLGDSVVFRWAGPRYIEYIYAVDSGSGYADGDILLTENSYVDVESESRPHFRANFSVDGKMGGLKIWLKSNYTRGCALYAISSIFPNSSKTLNCKIGNLIEGLNSWSGLLGNVTKVDNYGRILDISLVSGVKVLNVSLAPEIALRDYQNVSNTSCQCVSGDWSDCLGFLVSQVNLQIIVRDNLKQGMGFSGSVDAVNSDGSVRNVSVQFEGVGYSENITFEILEETDVPLVSNQTCECFADGASSWNGCIGYYRNRGAVNKTIILNRGNKYFSDEHLEIVYTGTQIPMTSTITEMWIKPTPSRNCALELYSSVYAKENSTLNCSVGLLLTGSSDGTGLVGNITSIDAFGRITGIEILRTAKVFDENPNIQINGDPHNSCTCLAGKWSDCLNLISSPVKIDIRIDGDMTGFHSQVNNVSKFGSILGVQISSHGSGFSSRMIDGLKFVVHESSDFDHLYPWGIPTQQCQCTGISWSDCFGVSVAEGSGVCRGGDSEGNPCTSDLPCVSACEDTCSPNEIGRCFHSPAAVLTAPSIQDNPARLLRPVYVEQGDWWTPPERLSSTVPLDVLSKVSIPNCQGAAAIAHFRDKSREVYLACAIYYSQVSGSESASIIYQIQVLDDKLSIHIEPIQYIDTNAANDVEAWEMNYELQGASTFVAFACEGGPFSPLLRWNDDKHILEHIQNIKTTGAVSLQVFVNEGTSYMLVGQSGQESQVLRWNGTLFLGLNSIETLPKDLAGGQILMSDNVQAALFCDREFQGKYLILGNYFSNTNIYRARIENVTGFRNPSSAVFTADMRFVYVSCYGSRSIASFNFAVDGIYELNYNRTNLLEASKDVPLAGIYALAIYTSSELDENNANRSYLYSASVIDDGGKINVFYIESSSGLLIEKSEMRLFGPNLGLRGVCTLLVTQTSLYSASIFDQSISAFNINQTTGELLYVDHVTNGERLLLKFVNQLASWIKSTDIVAVPWRNFKINKHVVSIKIFDFLNQTILAITSASSQASRPDGEALLFKFSNGSLLLFQTLESGTFPTDMEYVCIQDNHSQTVHYLLVASEMGPVMVYKWQGTQGRFSLDSSLPNSARKYPTYASMLTARVDNLTIVILTAHCNPPCSSKIQNSTIYYWKEIDKKFAVFQILNTASFDVSFAVWLSPSGKFTTLLALGNYGDFELSGYCSLYEYDASIRNNITGRLGLFLPLNTNASIPGKGVSAVSLFEISGAGQFLAISSRQHNASTPSGYFSQGSGIYLWKPESKTFHFYQSLDEFTSTPIRSIDTSIFNENTMVGATDLKIFAVDGETYLGIAQSICAWPLAFGTCQSWEGYEPQSTVLQWIRSPSPGRFSELSTISDSKNIKIKGSHASDFDLVHHVCPLRVPLVGALRIDFAILENKPYVFVSSFSSGLISFEWTFEEVLGLQRVISLAALTNTSIVAASQAEGALSIFEWSNPEHPSLSLSQQQLFYVTNWIDIPDSENSWALGSFPSIRGVRSIELQDCNSYVPWNPSEICIIAHTNAPENERLCGSYDPYWPPWVNPLESDLGPLPCQSVTFHVVEIPVDGTAAISLFEEGPKISKDGILFFALKKNQFGKALLRVELVDDGSEGLWKAYSAPYTYDTSHGQAPKIKVGENTSRFSFVTIDVLPLLESLSFFSVPVVVNAGEMSNSTFADSIPVVQNQKIIFLWNWIWLKAENMRCMEAQKVQDIHSFDECQIFCSSCSMCSFITFSETDSNVLCSFANDTCTLIPGSADTYKTPQVYFEAEPVLQQNVIGNSGDILLHPKVNALKSFEMNVTAIDARKKDMLIHTRNELWSSVVEINVISRNQPPNFLVSNLSVYGNTGISMVSNFLTNVSAGTGECSCYEKNCIYGAWPNSLPCQNLSFSLVQVLNINSDGLLATSIFNSFELDIADGSLAFSLMPNISGSFRLDLSVFDDGDLVLGDSTVGGKNSTIKSVYLAANVKQRYQKLESLIIPETYQLSPGKYQYFQIFPSVVFEYDGHSKTVLDQTSFKILNFSCMNHVKQSVICSSLFSILPSLDNNGTLSFCLEPATYGAAYLNVTLNISGLFYADAYQDSMVIQIMNVNTAPTCVFPENITVIDSLFPQVISPFAMNISAGPPNERWQSIVFSVSVSESPMQQYMSSPILDSRGYLHFQLTGGVFGISTILVTCFDNGGTTFGGLDHSAQQKVLCSFTVYDIVSINHMYFDTLLK